MTHTGPIVVLLFTLLGVLTACSGERESGQAVSAAGPPGVVSVVMGPMPTEAADEMSPSIAFRPSTLSCSAS